MTSQTNNFDYKTIDVITADFLKAKEFNIREIVGKASTQVGKELKEAQEQLIGSNQHDGLFEKWYTSLGYKKQTVYNLINRYNLLVQNLDYQNELEALPDSLLYEASKPSANPQTVQAVLSGDVRTLKEFKELERQLKEKSELLESTKAAAEHWQKVAKSAQNMPPRVETKTIEVVPDHVTRQIESLKKQLETAKELQRVYEKDSKEYQELKGQISFLNREKDDLHRQIESATALSGLAAEIDHMLKTKLAPVKYSRVWERMDSEVAVKNFTDILNNVRAWLEDMERYVPKQNRKVIDYDPAS